ncbi:HNH endonuclease [Rhodococcus spongiicola]|uniref:HNH endonuclease n=1 Tax=Rhodococcus spongiicola TaxID=2487352 RepID=A0A438B5G4_9NOCA|nr:HNH endonuclease [Rhodococcus spongiicola]RVW06235.1 HNH endonuclease [Rhodococcus spongiicola]
MANERSTRRHKTLRADFRSRCHQRAAPCHLCGQPIDYTLPREHPDAFQLDHYHPVKTHPELVDDTNNFRASHGGCNASRGAGEPTATLGTPSETW